MSFFREEDGNVKVGRIIGLIICFVIISSLFSMFLTPLLKVWWAEQSGKAELAQAEQNRQIAILEAQAKYESSIKLAQADIERAKGVAEANRIISGSITENYLKYEFIQGLNDGSTEVIYVPTEANLPILEARDKK